MKEYLVRPYQQEDYPLWNTFVQEAKNATFLFHRDFMEYHKDRFEDYSLLVFEKEKRDKVVALLPANRVNDTLYSHQGLSYGGLVVSEKLKTTNYILLFKSVLQYLCQQGIAKIQIKPIPLFYNNYFSEEIEYALFLAQADLVRRDVFSVVDLQQPLQLSKDRKEGVKRGMKNALSIQESNDFEAFWNQILIPNLTHKHGVAPVHSLEEISKLKKQFPDAIRQFNVYDGDAIIGGTTIFVSKNVAHSQYISGNELKNETGSLDFLHHHLLTEVFKEKHYFDFGISNEQQGKKLNYGLSYWKESYGAHAVVQNFYEVQTTNYTLLEDVFV